MGYISLHSKHPVILYDLAPLTNPSFETGSDGAAPASPWDENASAPNLCEIDTAWAHDKGSNHAKAKSCLCDRQGGQPDFYLRQVVPSSWKPPVGVVVGAMGLIRKVDTSGGDVLSACTVKIQEMNGAAVLAESNNAITLGFSTASDEIAVFLVSRTLNQASADGIRLNFDTWNTNSAWQIDSIIMGRAVVFGAVEFSRFNVIPETFSTLNLADGAYEVIQNRDPTTRVQARIEDLTLDSALENALVDFLGYSRTHRPFALWLDRNVHTNDGLHFAEGLLLPEAFRQPRPSGAGRYTLDLNFLAPKEWVQQEVTA